MVRAEPAAVVRMPPIGDTAPILPSCTGYVQGLVMVMWTRHGATGGGFSACGMAMKGLQWLRRPRQ